MITNRDLYVVSMRIDIHIHLMWQIHGYGYWYLRGCLFKELGMNVNISYPIWMHPCILCIPCLKRSCMCMYVSLFMYSMFEKIMHVYVCHLFCALHIYTSYGYGRDMFPNMNHILIHIIWMYLILIYDAIHDNKFWIWI